MQYRDHDYLSLVSMRFVLDTGCGFSLAAERFMQSVDAMDNIWRLSPGVALNVARGSSGALGAVIVARWVQRWSF
eukprot:1047374-Pyramimonas_sp.AAC.1